MRINKLKSSAIIMAFIINILMGTSVFAAPEAASISMFDENAYTRELDSKMDHLDRLYLKSIEKNLSQADVLKTRMEYFKIARELLQNFNERFDKLHPEQGDALSATEMLVVNHVQIMIIDMLASIHESGWAEDQRLP